MSELIKRLERVIAAGVPDKNGQHPISAEAVLGVVKQLQTAEVGTDLAQLGTDCISRQAVIKDAESWVAVDEYEKHMQKNVVEWLKEFPSAQPEIIRCKDCLYQRICSWKLQGAEYCSFAEKRER